MKTYYLAFFRHEETSERVSAKRQGHDRRIEGRSSKGISRDGRRTISGGGSDDRDAIDLLQRHVQVSVLQF